MQARRRLALVLVGVCGAVSLSAQSTGLKRVMREKLVTSQEVLGAVVTSDWAALEVQSKKLEAITSDPAWMALKSPEYAQQSESFRKAVRTLREAASRRDLEATPQAYVAVTLSCVQCHRYLGRARLAGQ